MKQVNQGGTQADKVVCLAAPFPPTVGGMAVQGKKLADRLSEEGVEVVRLDAFPRPPKVLEFTSGIRGVRTAVRALQYLRLAHGAVQKAGVVHHLAGSELNFLLHTTPLLLMCRRYKKRVVLNLRSGCSATRLLGRWRRLGLPVIKMADAVITPSAFLQRALADNGVNACIVPNIADPEMFTFRERRTFAPRLFVSRQLEPVYDVSSILLAFAIVQAQYPEAVLGIAGPGSQERLLRAMVNDLGLRDVVFYGQVTNRDMPALYEQYDIAVNASLIDNFPGSIVEAALSGLAIVSTAAGGIVDMICDGETGSLVPLRDYRALAAAVLDLLKHQDSAYDRTRKARRWAEQFSWRRIYPLLLRCYGYDAAPFPSVDAQHEDDRSCVSTTVAD